MIIVQSLSSSDPPSGIASPAGEVSSSTSTTSTLSVEIDDEDLISTRSPSPFEDMMDSQMTMSSGTEPVSEDLPEGLRLMRVVQRHGVKVVDFAFEGPKRHGVVEDWAWEGGAACKGFGIGFGGGAYNGVLKKYRPPPKEMPEDPEEDDRMMVDKPNNYHQKKCIRIETSSSASTRSDLLWCWCWHWERQASCYRTTTKLTRAAPSGIRLEWIRLYEIFRRKAGVAECCFCCHRVCPPPDFCILPDFRYWFQTGSFVCVIRTTP